MSKIVFNAAFFLLLFSSSSAQTWMGIGSGATATVTTLCYDSSDHSLYAGGRFTKLNGNSTSRIARWDGSSWTGLSKGMDGNVYTVVAANGKIYVGGEFSNAGDSLVKAFAEWDGTNFRSYGGGFFQTGQHAVSATIYAIAFYKGQLYAGGLFDQASGKYARYIARWNGMEWESVGGGLDGSSGVQTMVVYKDELYVGGGFTNAGSVLAKYIAKWDGTTWTDVGNGMNSNVNTLAVYNGELYAGGAFTSAGGTDANYIARWNGSSWNTVGSGTNNMVNALSINNRLNFLEVGGSFTAADNKTANRYATWNGSSWNVPATTFNGAIWALCATPDKTFAGGDFTLPGAKMAQYSLNTGIDDLPSAARSFSVFPNPATTEIKLPGTYAVVSLRDLAGKEILTASNTAALDVSSLQGGLYILLARQKPGDPFSNCLITIQHEK